jgi:hypothetical protein
MRPIKERRQTAVIAKRADGIVPEREILALALPSGDQSFLCGGAGILDGATLAARTIKPDPNLTLTPAMLGSRFYPSSTKWRCSNRIEST